VYPGHVRSLSLSLSLCLARTCGRLMARAAARLRGRAQPAISRLRDICEIQARRTENTPPGKGEREGRFKERSPHALSISRSTDRVPPDFRGPSPCHRRAFSSHEERALEPRGGDRALLPSPSRADLDGDPGLFKELTGYVRRPVARASRANTEEGENYAGGINERVW